MFISPLAVTSFISLGAVAVAVAVVIVVVVVVVVVVVGPLEGVPPIT